MVHGQFEKVLEDVKALSPEEQRQLRAWLDKICDPAPAPMTEEEFAHQLHEAGLLSEVKPPITDFTPYQPPPADRDHGETALGGHHRGATLGGRLCL